MTIAPKALSKERYPLIRSYGVLVGLFVTVAAAVGGCDGTGGYSNNGQQLLTGQVSPHSVWRVTSTLLDSSKAIDGDISTAAVGRGSGNDTITIDLGKVCMFNLVIIHHGGNANGHCKRVGVLTSLDGQDFAYRGSASGKRKVTNILLGQYVLARYLRLQAVIPGTKPWSIAEIYLQ